MLGTVTWYNGCDFHALHITYEIKWNSEENETGKFIDYKSSSNKQAVVKQLVSWVHHGVGSYKLIQTVQKPVLPPASE